MITIKRTNSNNPDFINLVRDLDKYLAITDGEEHDFYDQFNKLDRIKHVVLIYNDRKIIGCGALKHSTPNKMEIKRMYVKPEFRKSGYASKILEILKQWAIELGYQICVLETGSRQTEAIALYYRNHYKVIPNYPPYENRQNSLCFEKKLHSV
ncbi:GNAT family N-acetyltransferase [Christiangramia sp.]|uniref:GNAT family N-acetyltransferase n=1 Tax=Christiangramia sp. TaxID=1931228 RepID=UPI002604F443|nr:GNAT family N-acetyltransferase [Christiangramia sp.]